MNERFFKRALHFLIFQLILCVLLIGCLVGCKTVKEVTKEVTKYDSTAIKENKALKRTLSEEIERFEKEKEKWEQTGVIFETTPCPDSAKTVPTTILFDNGKLKSIQGNVRSLTSDLYEKSAELYDANRMIDSLQYALELEQKNVKHETITIEKEVKTKVSSFPFWLLIACVIGGQILESKFKIINRVINIFSLIKL